MSVNISLSKFRCPCCGKILEKTFEDPIRRNSVCCGNCSAPVSCVVMGGGAAPGAGGDGGIGGKSIPWYVPKK